MGYTKDALKGISWMGALRVFIRGLGFLRIAVLARLLSPEQFGIFGIVTLILSFLEIATETGINVFLIQLKDSVDVYVDTAWIVSILRGMCITVVIVVCTPWIAAYFGTPTAGSLLYFVALVPLIRGFINPAVVKFQKNLEFNKEFALRTLLYGVDAISVIGIAFFTRSTVSLVWGLVISSVIEVLMSFIFIKPTPKFSFDKEKAKKVIGRGKWVTGFGLFDYLFQNVDDAIIGKFLGTSPLGIYQVAYKISSLPVSEVADVFSKVTIPVYTKFNDDIQRLQRAFMRTFVLTTLLMVGFGVVVFLFPYQIVLILLGPNWIEAAGLLKILALFGVLKGMTGIIQSLFLAVGKQEYVTIVTFVTLIGLLATIFPLVQRFGLMGAGISAVIGSFVGLLVCSYFCFLVLRK